MKMSLLHVPLNSCRLMIDIRIIWNSLIDVIIVRCIVPNLHLFAGHFYNPCTSYLLERIARDCDCYSESLANTAVDQPGQFSFRLPACVPDSAGIPSPLPVEFIVNGNFPRRDARILIPGCAPLMRPRMSRVWRC